MKLPRGDHLQGLIWFDRVNTDIPGWGVLDVAYLRNNHTDYMFQSGLTTGRNNFYGFRGKLNTSQDITEEFHEFTVEWTKWNVSWAIDGNVYHFETLQRYFGHKDNKTYDRIGKPFDRSFFLKFENFFDIRGYSDNQIDYKTWVQPALYVDYFKSYKWVNATDSQEFQMKGN